MTSPGFSAKLLSRLLVRSSHEVDPFAFCPSRMSQLRQRKHSKIQCQRPVRGLASLRFSDQALSLPGVRRSPLSFSAESRPDANLSHRLQVTDQNGALVRRFPPWFKHFMKG